MLFSTRNCLSGELHRFQKKRLEQLLTQVELANCIGVEETTISNWENKRSNPHIHLLLKIIEFLGYIPFEFPKVSISEKIIAYRNGHGLSQRRLVKLLGVDQTTIRYWERNKHKPNKEITKKI
jgi:DNA-binding XRE family transcriptional regulator